VADRILVDQVVRFAFVIRLASLLLVLLVPTDETTRMVSLVAIVFVTVTSGLGLLATPLFTRNVITHPILLVLDVLAATLVAALLGSQSPIMLYSLSTAVLIGILLRPPLAAIVLAILVFSYILVTISQDATLSPMSALMIPVTYATVGALGSLTRTLHESAMRDQAVARRLSEDAARERERARLAREMHDSVAKSLHGIGLAAASLPGWADKGDGSLSTKARELQAAAESASQDARSILVDLRTDTDDRTLAQQLRTLTDDLVAGGLQAELIVEGVGDCDHAVKRELVAIAAEAIENVRRHSRSDRVDVSCIGTADTITLDIRDDGVGFDVGHTPQGHFGVVGMRERAEAIGAVLELSSALGNGTSLLVTAPRSINGDSLNGGSINGGNHV
jgi:signal transduction histidine kinase